MSATKFEYNLSSGSVAKQLIVFAMPMLISNLIQSLYSVADMIIVGKLCGAASMSGVNIGGQVTFVLTNMVFGICVGGTVLIAQYLGHGDHREMAETIATLFTFIGLAALVITAVMLPLSRPVLRLMQTPAESFEEAAGYLFYTMIGCIFIFAYNALSAVMRGLGDSKRPMYFVLIACFVNVGLDLLFVAVFHLGARGAAIATVISQAISVILCILYLRGHDFVFDFHPRSFRITGERLRMLLKVGIPTSVQNTVVGFSFIFLTSLVNTLGVSASAAVGAVAKINNFAILPGVAFSSAISAMSAQNIGAGQIHRASATMRTGLLISEAISLGVFALVRAIPADLLWLFCDDPAVIEAGVQYMTSFSLDYLVLPILFSFNGLFIGSGHTRFPLFNGISSSILLRIPLSWFMGIYLGLGMHGMGYATPIATATAMCAALVFYLTGRWKRMVVLSAPIEPAPEA